MRKSTQHVRQQAKKHQEEHLYLKELLNKVVYSEGLIGWFAGTFVITLATILIFFNWGKITSLFSESENEAEKELIEQTLAKVHGFKAGISTSDLIEGQVANEYLKKINAIRTGAYVKGITTSNLLSTAKEWTNQDKINMYRSSLIWSYQLGNGDHLSANQTAASTLQKSLITSYYLGEKTNFLHSTLKNDAQLLSKISNSLSIDIFAYLNQSVNRADGLENYLHLLETLQQNAQQRTLELQSQINFLSTNFEAQEITIGLTEDEFFNSLQMFNGDDADAQLTDFIGLQKDQSEIRAKVGAYQKLKDYYDFFLPLLDTMTKAVKANRDPLIAGVKVVEIEHMQLPLIIQEN